MIPIFILVLLYIPNSPKIITAIDGVTAYTTAFNNIKLN